MQPQQGEHRKRVKHFDLPGHAHELTFSCYQRRPLLVSDAKCELLARSIDAAMLRHKFTLLGFVFMPEHVHLVAFPEDAEAQVNRLLFAIKRPFSSRVKALMEASESREDQRLLNELTVIERPGKSVFRYWQEGPGYDRNLTSPEAVNESLEYLHSNPLKRGLVRNTEAWKWSSWHLYHSLQSAQNPVLPVIDLSRARSLLA